MPYTRSRIKELYWGTNHDRIQLYKVEFYNCQKKVRGHYPNPLERDCQITSVLAYSGETNVAPISDEPDYRPNEPTHAIAIFDGSAIDYFAGDVTRLANQAYEKFVNQMKDQAQNANNLLEAGQSVGQIVSHVTALAKSVRAVKRGDIAGAAKALGVSISGSKEQRIKKRAKQAADRWLELHFGWEPLIQDIGSSIDIIQGTGKASKTTEKISTKGGASGQFAWAKSLSGISGPFIRQGADTFRCDIGIRLRGEVRVTNPNVALANQMGFVNPLSVAWEAIPFSFVVDWFSNVGQCLSAMSDFWGFEVGQGYTSRRQIINQNRVYESNVNGGRGQLMQSEFFSVNYVHVSRAAGLVKPELTHKPFHGFSPARGATAISLLVQQFKTL